MDTSTHAQNNNFGITSSTLLDNSYLDSLFTSDPQDITQIGQPEPPTEKEPSQEKSKAESAKPEAAPATPVNTAIEDSSFLDALDDKEDEQNAGSDKPKPAAPTSSSPLQEKDDNSAPNQATLDANIAAFGKELYDLGILNHDQEGEPEAIKNPEQLVQLLTQEKQKGAVQILENILSNFGPEYRDAFNAIYLEGVHPADYFGQVAQIGTLEELDMSNVENQRHVLRTHYKALGWDNAKISAKLEKLENYQDMEEEAKDVHAILLKQEKQKLDQKQQERKQELARKAANEQQHQQQLSRIIAERVKAKELDGIPLDEKTARSLSNYMMEKKWQLGDNQISDFEKEVLDLSRPENREHAVKVALIMHLLKIDPTLSRLQKKAVTKESEKIFSFLQREEATDKKQGRKRSNFFDD